MREWHDMHRSFLPCVGALAAGMLLVATAAAQDRPTAPNAAPSATNTPAPAIAEQAADRYSDCLHPLF
jgi:hypothetical protein